MAFIPVAGVMRLRLIYSSAGQTFFNILHARAPAAPVTLTDVVAAAQALETAWAAEVMPLLAIELNLSGVDAQGLDTATGPYHHEISTAAGTVATGSMPFSVAAVMTWETGFRDRARRGRSYIPGIPEAANSSSNANRWTTVFTDALQAAGEDVIAAMSTATYDLCVVSYQLNNAPRVSGLATDIIGSGVDPWVDSQNHRKGSGF